MVLNLVSVPSLAGKESCIYNDVIVVKITAQNTRGANGISSNLHTTSYCIKRSGATTPMQHGRTTPVLAILYYHNKPMLSLQC